jgi:hypothetical protein
MCETPSLDQTLLLDIIFKLTSPNNFRILDFHSLQLKVKNKEVKCKKPNVYMNGQLLHYVKKWLNIITQQW